MDGTRGANSWVSPAVATEPVPHVSDEAPSATDVVVTQADAFVVWLATISGAGVTDAVRVDRITALERVKGAVAAAQARQTVAFAASQRAAMPSWTPERVIARSIGSQIGLARHESPTRGDAHVALAEALVRAMPRTLAALSAGQISEGAAESVQRAVEDLDPTRRREVDSRLAPELDALGERSLAEAARRVVSDVDDAAATRRVERAIQSRRVTLRTAADGMAYLTLLAPMAEATGAFHAVEAETTAILGEPARFGTSSRHSSFWLDEPTEASTSASLAGSGDAPDMGGKPAGSSDVQPAGRALRACGARRTRSQMMADVVIARLTGRAIGQPVPIEIQLVMTDHTLAAATAARHTAAQPDADDHHVTSLGAPLHTAISGAAARDRTLVGAAGQAATHVDRPIYRTARPGSATIAAASPANVVGASPAKIAGTGPSKLEGASPAKIAASSPAKIAGTGPSKLAGASPARIAGFSPAKIVGAGWLPAGFAAGLVRRTVTAGSDVTVRRVFTGSDGATVVGMEARRRPLREDLAPIEPAAVRTPTTSTQRLFRGVLRRLVVVRDQTCRTPFCAAAIRAVDHIDPVRRRGPTRIDNAEGLCVRCNLTKEAPGWTVEVLSHPPKVRSNQDDPAWKQLMDELLAAEPDQAEPDCSHRTAVVTPTGHRYASTAPPVTEPLPHRLETTNARRSAHGPSG